MLVRNNVAKGRAIIGFTMVEMLVVISLLAAASTIVAPQLWRQYVAIKERKDVETFWSKVKMTASQYNQQGENFVFNSEQEQWKNAANELSLEIKQSDAIISRADGFVRGGSVTLKTVDKTNFWVISVQTPDGVVTIERQ
ncbi:type II secretion system protein [Vibrio mimicus]|uniref:type II secretion system protein n=1 Tax=Vibrio mimicus TaxID=674 RepID=UPI0006833105|nr:type II secretion system protein [Vibrio mimicus]